MQKPIYHSSESINFYPPLKKEITINQFRVKVLDVELFKSCRIAVGLFDSDNNYITEKFYMMEENDYLQWSNDDTYVYSFVKRKLREEYELSLSKKVINQLKQKSNNNS